MIYQNVYILPWYDSSEKNHLKTQSLQMVLVFKTTMDVTGNDVANYILISMSNGSLVLLHLTGVVYSDSDHWIV